MILEGEDVVSAQTEIHPQYRDSRGLWLVDTVGINGDAELKQRGECCQKKENKIPFVQRKLLCGVVPFRLGLSQCPVQSLDRVCWTILVKCCWL